MEDWTANVKTTGSISGKIKKLGIFNTPHDLFMKILLNLTVIVKEDGEVLFENSALNANAAFFVSKLKTKTAYEACLAM